VRVGTIQHTDYAIDLEIEPSLRHWATPSDSARWSQRCTQGDSSMREIIIVADSTPTITDHSFVVTTPLDAIDRLERERRVRTVVLAGTFARDTMLAAFLGEFYPSIHVERDL
jgi:hypothetical protein